MDFAFTEDQLAIKDSVGKLCAGFDGKYWLKKDKEGGFPEDFYRAVADAGWLGIAMPEEYGGAGLGITEAAIMMQAVAESGAALQGASAIHLNVFGPNPIVVFGTEEQKKRILPDIIKGKVKGCFAVTEPDAGLNTTALDTKAERDGNGYIVHGKKTFTTTASVADKMLLIARTTPKDKCKRPTDGLSLFYTDFDRSKIEVTEIDKMGRKAIDTNQVFIDGLKVPLEDRIGEEGKGFHYLLHGLNPERILIAAEAIGIGKAALAKATQYAKERIVFGRPIGKNQAIQHPLAESWMQLEAANLLTFKGAWLYDNGKDCGQVSRRPHRLRRLRARDPDPWRLRLRQGVPRRALPARGHDRPHRSGQRAADPVLRRRARARPAEELLSPSSWRGRKSGAAIRDGEALSA
jgi:acyl-CoA dehydrogenase